MKRQTFWIQELGWEDEIETRAVRAVCSSRASTRLPYWL